MYWDKAITRIEIWDEDKVAKQLGDANDAARNPIIPHPPLCNPF